ncbi:DNA binding protein, DksA/TraR family [Fictibacillus macauensis ZFHKF-1]|uniref:DNA binding protein, DksA/TraR family n=1 Tax=Fictibacillus macauensis ZFHKF-1 TaxID=1196324 RepID=I8UK73_9BACL|nr:TraR/DksA C4-type zinc finger protein [Fictibacillus macauensis]EIT87228.1 DNA binding protein, DksA/TraR family [Fictibacillus macauensis ZFHKF-1]
MSLTNEQLQHLKNLLLQMKTTLENKHEKNKMYGLEIQQSTSTGELSLYDNHPADVGTELFEREKDLVLNQLEKQTMHEVTEALQRIHDQTYGYCKVCQCEIPFERLHAIPETAYCAEHSPVEHGENNRPLEESMLTPPFHSNNDQETSDYDAEDSWQDAAIYGTSETPSDFATNRALDYNDMIINDEENIGYTEEIEGFLATDMDGSNPHVIPNKAHEAYEKRVDEYEGGL